MTLRVGKDVYKFATKCTINKLQTPFGAICYGSLILIFERIDQKL